MTVWYSRLDTQPHIRHGACAVHPGILVGLKARPFHSARPPGRPSVHYIIDHRVNSGSRCAAHATEYADRKAKPKQS